MASLTVVKDFDVVEDRVREFDSGFPSLRYPTRHRRIRMRALVQLGGFG